MNAEKYSPYKLMAFCVLFIIILLFSIAEGWPFRLYYLNKYENVNIVLPKEYIVKCNSEGEYISQVGDGLYVHLDEVPRLRPFPSKWSSYKNAHIALAAYYSTHNYTPCK